MSILRQGDERGTIVRVRTIKPADVAEPERVSQEVISLIGRRDDLKSQVAQLGHDIQQLRAVIRGLQEERELEGRAVQNRHAEAEALQTQIEARRVENDNLTAESEALREETERLRDEREGLHAGIDALRAEADAIRAEIDALRKQGDVAGRPTTEDTS